MYNNLSLLDIEKWSNQYFRYHEISLFYPPIYHLDILDDYQEHTWQILGHQWRRKALSELLSNLHLCFQSLRSETIEICTKCATFWHISFSIAVTKLLIFTWLQTCIAADNLGRNSSWAVFRGDGPWIRCRNGLADKMRSYKGPATVKYNINDTIISDKCQMKQ